MKIRIKLPISNNELPTNNCADNGKRIDLLKSLIYSMNESNQTKIQFIIEEIRAATYEINSKIIASKILENTIVKIFPKEIELA